MPYVRLATVANGREYTYVESGRRACLLEDGTTLWWGCVDDAIPCDVVPLEVLLTLSVLKEAAWML